MRRLIEVWVCECGNYYAASSVEGVNLSKEWNTDHKNRPTITRDTCPRCRAESNDGTKRVWRYAVILDFGPTDHVGEVDESKLVEEAYRLLKEAKHESVRQ